MHITVCANLREIALDAVFDVSEVPDNVVFCDEWLAQWAKHEREEGADWVAEEDLTGVYTRDRFCNLIEREGEDVSQAQLLKTSLVR
jgi:hypothetical protein